MTAELLLNIGAVGLFAHGLFAFIHSLPQGPSPYRDFQEIQLSGLPTECTLSKFLSAEVCRNLTRRRLMAAAVTWAPVIRWLGLWPILLYGIAFLMTTASPIMAPSAQPAAVAFWVFVGGFGIHISYVVLRIFSALPHALQHCHRDYEEHGYGWILFDFIPLFKGKGPGK